MASKIKSFKKIVLFFVAAILFGLNFYTANAAKGQVDEGYYVIESVLDRNKVLDINGASKDNGANLQIWRKNGSPAQTFQIKKAKDGYCTITAVCSGKVLDVAGGKKVAGTNVQQYKSNSSDAQMWKFEHVKDDIFTINSKLGNFCLDVEGGKTDNGTNVSIWNKMNKPNQQFRFIKVDVNKGSSKNEAPQDAAKDQKKYALPTAENCYSCFENQEQSEIMVKKLNKEDKQILKNMIDEDTDFTKFLGYGVDDFNSDEYLKGLENDCKLVFTIKNKDNEVLGLIFVNESSNENQLNVGYWIGKNFRGNGYVPLALSKMMSKIWQLDKSISFEFWIDDENAASMKAFHKTCNNLKIDPQNSVSKKNTLKIEMLSEKIDDNNYFVKTFVNGSLNDTKTVSKQQLLKLYSEDKLKTGVLLKSFASMYSVKSPQLVLENDAELLYTRMTEFLSKNNDVTPEKIDDVCKEIIGSKIPESNLLSKQDFEEKSVGNTVLYRGVENKSYADEFKNGKVFISCWNVRGSGIYTTTSLDCAKSYANKQNPDDTLIKMFISKSNVKILNNDYLEKLKELIVNRHSEEFGEFENKCSNDYIFDSAADYINKAFEETQQKLDEMNLSEEDYVKEEEKVLKEFGDKLKKDPVCQKLIAERKKYYKSNKAYVWFNSGLLTKLMGFDILYTNGSLRDFFVGTEDEYLIVNPNILNVLKA